MRRASSISALCILLVAGSATTAQGLYLEEPEDSGWALYFDNDVLTPRGTDRDYTGGFSFTFAGRRAQRATFEKWRVGFDRLFGTDRLYADRTFSRHSLETGLTIFTPGDLKNPAAQVGDRPYASLLYLSHTSSEVLAERDLAYLSTLTLGVLGAGFVEDFQRGACCGAVSSSAAGCEAKSLTQRNLICDDIGEFGAGNGEFHLSLQSFVAFQRTFGQALAHDALDLALGIDADLLEELANLQVESLFIEVAISHSASPDAAL
jgi:hypothetical protein